VYAKQRLPQPADAAAPHWSLGRRIAFRFFAPYLVLYHLDWLLGRFGEPVRQALYRAPMRTVDGWIGTKFFGLKPSDVNLGFGGFTDVPLFYIHIFVLLLCSALIATVWSLLDRKRTEYQSLHAWVRLLVRYSLASSLFFYGFNKVFVAQMEPVWMYPERLVERFGDMSPAALLWSTIGYSPAYEIFGGLAEVFAASLLLFRRTTTLGALVAIGVMLNVVMLNFGYQVALKLPSMNLLLAAIFLAAPDLGKLTRFFVFNQRVDAPDASDPILEKRVLRFALTVTKVVVASLMLYNSISIGYRDAMFRPPSNRPILFGLYEVETFVENGTERLPLTTDTARWKTVTIGDPSTIMTVQMMDASFRHHNAEYDMQGNSVTLSVGSGDKKKKYTLQCSRPDQDHLVMEGKFGEDALAVRMKRIDLSTFDLLNMPFRWTGRTDIH
jgi:uncharacterized membrane protein YphA (DoxX/SURF4 family)